MPRLRHSILSFCWVVLLISVPVYADEIWLTDLNQARKIATETNRPILLHFYAGWCGPCHQMDQQVFPTPQVRGQLQATVVPVKIDVEKQRHLSNRFEVTSLPTDIFLEPDGTEILQSSGFRNMNEYVGLVMRAHTRYADLLASRAPKPKEDPLARTPDNSDSVKPAGISEVMLSGYCPVTLWTSRRWEKGSIQFQTDYKDQRYYFAGAAELQRFKQSPERFVPQFLGCDPVIVWETDRAIPGDISFGAFYDERLYLFTSEQTRKRFKASPDRFIKTQVVLRVDQIERVVR